MLPNLQDPSKNPTLINFKKTLFQATQTTTDQFNQVQLESLQEMAAIVLACNDGNLLNGDERKAIETIRDGVTSRLRRLESNK
jgi:hypothetical protein